MDVHIRILELTTYFDITDFLSFLFEALCLKWRLSLDKQRYMLKEKVTFVIFASSSGTTTFQKWRARNRNVRIKKNFLMNEFQSERHMTVTNETVTEAGNASDQSE